MEPFMTDALTRRRKGFLRNGIVKVLPIKRSSDWLPDNSDSAFMNTGAKVEYVVPRLARSGHLLDPLGDLNDDEKNKIAKELGFKDGTELNVNRDQKQNYWINKAVILDKNGKFLNLSTPGDFIEYKILEVNLETIAPSFTERYDKGTYKFAIVFEDEESKMKTSKIDTKKEAYMQFGKIDGSVKKMTDFLWIYYLTDKEGKRLPINPSLEYLRGETGRILEEKPGTFLSIMTDHHFETKALIQKSINIGLIQRDGMNFKVFGEDTMKGSLDDMIEFLNDERNNNVRLSLIGKIESVENAGINTRSFNQKTDDIESESDKKLKEVLEQNKKLQEQLLAMQNQTKPRGPRKKDSTDEQIKD